MRVVLFVHIPPLAPVPFYYKSYEFAYKIKEIASKSIACSHSLITAIFTKIIFCLQVKMAATLPAIHSAAPSVKSQSINQHQIASPRSKASFSIGQARKRGQSKKDRELEQKRVTLRAQQPVLQKWQTAT